MILRRSLHEWLLDRPRARRALLHATLDPAQVGPFLARYMNRSRRAHAMIHVLNPILIALVVTYSGPFWTFALVVSFAWLLAWRRLIGCQYLSRKSRDQLNVFLGEEGAKWNIPSAMERKWTVETMDDWRVLMRAVDPLHRSQLQALCLEDQTPSITASTRHPRL